jgi:hypothetical protein
VDTVLPIATDVQFVDGRISGAGAGFIALMTAAAEDAEFVDVLVS